MRDAIARGRLVPPGGGCVSPGGSSSLRRLLPRRSGSSRLPATTTTRSACGTPTRVIARAAICAKLGQSITPAQWGRLRARSAVPCAMLVIGYPSTVGPVGCRGPSASFRAAVLLYIGVDAGRRRRRAGRPSGQTRTRRAGRWPLVPVSCSSCLSESTMLPTSGSMSGGAAWSSASKIGTQSDSAPINCPRFRQAAAGGFAVLGPGTGLPAGGRPGRIRRRSSAARLLQPLVVKDDPAVAVAARAAKRGARDIFALRPSGLLMITGRLQLVDVYPGFCQDRGVLAVRFNLVQPIPLSRLGRSRSAGTR